MFCGKAIRYRRQPRRSISPSTQAKGRVSVAGSATSPAPTTSKSALIFRSRTPSNRTGAGVPGGCELSAGADQTGAGVGYGLRLRRATVAAEKWYLASVDGFTPRKTRAFLKRVIDDSLPHVFAVAGEVVDFATSFQIQPKGSRMSGGLVWAYGWNGGGRGLDACLALARKAGRKGGTGKCIPTMSSAHPALRFLRLSSGRPEGPRLKTRESISGRRAHGPSVFEPPAAATAHGPSRCGGLGIAGI